MRFLTVFGPGLALLPHLYFTLLNRRISHYYLTQIGRRRSSTRLPYCTPTQTLFDSDRRAQSTCKILTTPPCAGIVKVK